MTMSDPALPIRRALGVLVLSVLVVTATAPLMVIGAEGDAGFTEDFEDATNWSIEVNRTDGWENTLHMHRESKDNSTRLNVEIDKDSIGGSGTGFVYGYPNYTSMPDAGTKIYEFEWDAKAKRKFDDETMDTSMGLTNTSNTSQDYIFYNHNLSDNQGMGGTLVNSTEIVNPFPNVGTQSLNNSNCQQDGDGQNCEDEKFVHYKLLINETDDVAFLFVNGTKVYKSELTGDIPRTDTQIVLRGRAAPQSAGTTVKYLQLWVDNVTSYNVVGAEPDLRLEVPSHMWHNETASYEVWDDQDDPSEDITDKATVTSSDPTNLTVNTTSNKLEATSDLSFSGEITITVDYQDETVSKNVTVANMSVSNVDLMQNAGDMTVALWGDPTHPDTGTRLGGTQLTMRILLIAIGVGAAVATWSSSFGAIGGVVVVVTAGWFMGWVNDGMAMITVFTGLFIGLNVAANIDYSVRK